MEKLRKMIPYLLINTLIFYLLPYLIKDTGSAMIILLVIVPVASFLVAYAYGYKNSFSWIFPILVMLIFTPTVFIFYNESATIYIFAYGIISLIGSLLGYKIKSNEEGIWNTLQKNTTLFSLMILMARTNISQ